MPTGDILRVGVTGLLSFQRNLNTVGHNISNVNTEGYSRQRTELVANDPSPHGDGFVGNGVRSVTTRRIFDQHAEDQVRSRSASTEFFTKYHDYATQVDNLLADKDAGLSPAIESFFDSVQNLADDPVSIPSREVMMTQSQALIDRFHTLEQWLGDLRKATNSDISAEVSKINSLAKSIAEINHQIVVATGIGQGQPPNDLLDRRDQMITELSKHIKTTTVAQDDGSVNVFIGVGQRLVLGTIASQLASRPDPDDPSTNEVVYVNEFSSSFVPISDTLTGGDLGGVLEFRKQILYPSFNHLGRLAAGLALTFNDQHQEGMNLYNQIGGDYFTVPVPKWKQGYSNSSLVININDVSFIRPAAVGPQIYDVTSNTYPLVTSLSSNYDAASIKTTDYKLTYLGPANPAVAGGTWDFELLDKETNERRYFSLDTAQATTLQVDGMYVDVSTLAGMVPKDYFTITPTRGASRQLEMAVRDPNEIAAASLMRTDAVYSNIGDGEITEVTITDVKNASLATTGKITPPVFGPGTEQSKIQIQFYDNAGTLEYYITDASYNSAVMGIPPPVANTIAGPVVYPPAGNDILAGAGLGWGWDFQISGTPYAKTIVAPGIPSTVGDSFIVEFNTNGFSDNRNARELANLQVTGTLIGGNATYHEAYSEIVTTVGTRTEQADINQKAQSALLQQSKERREAISGVNLDEEAANLLRFQQAYSAAAQVIAAADSVFQTLLQAVRR